MAQQRLDKIIASTGRYSRREVKTLVREGRVLVDGRIAASAEDKCDPLTARIRVNDALQKQDARQTECRHMKLCRHDFPFRFRPAALTKTGVHSQREDARSGSEQACP